MTNSNKTVDESKVATEEKVWRWIDQVVIGENFCPFAKVPRDEDKINIVVTDELSVKEILHILSEQLNLLNTNRDIETTLIVLSEATKDFYDYLEVLDLSQRLLEELGYEGEYQLASFHPDYLFEGEAADSLSHYTNRAPYPILHLIRESSIEKGLSFVTQPEDIFSRNIEHANALGKAFFKQFL